MNIQSFFSYFLFLFLAGCSSDQVKLVNKKQNSLESSVKLEVIIEKKFSLDNETAPKAQYTQLFESSDSVRYFTFLNKYNNTIYFYDYSTQRFFKKLEYKNRGPEAIQNISAYYIKSLDSIYLYCKPLPIVILVNDKGKVLQRISLIGDRHNPKWFFHYPQYFPLTVTPFIETSEELLLPGQFMGSSTNFLIDFFKFTARINLKTHNLSFSFLYPQDLYDPSYNWEGRLFTEIFAELHPDGNKLILSFPISHDLYIADLKSEEYQKVFAGSNFAGTISSIDRNPRKTSDRMSLDHFVLIDTYSTIKYDKYRKIYYRFLLNAIQKDSERSYWREKPVTIIVMDENFNYLGETAIGKGEVEWYWQNSFVTKEGLNIEYIIRDNEDSLILKIFSLKNI